MSYKTMKGYASSKRAIKGNNPRQAHLAIGSSKQNCLNHIQTCILIKKSIRKSQANATMQAFKRHISHNNEQRMAQIFTQGKTIQKQLKMQRQSIVLMSHYFSLVHCLFVLILRVVQCLIVFCQCIFLNLASLDHYSEF